MQVRNTIWTLTALCAMSLVMTGCPEEGGEGSLTCASATDCLESEICHPTAKVCVATCASSADCPDTAKTCAAVSATDQTKVCQCSTDALCNTDRETPDLVCSTLDKVCTTKCTTDASCGTGRTCDTATGQCKAGGGNTGDTCTGESQSTCAYGQFCSASKCTAAPVAAATCQNFSTNRPNWSATSSNGPVIYDIRLLRYETNSSFCQSGDAYIFSLRAYRTDADWPATRSGVAGFFYVTTGGTQTDVVNSGLLLPNTGYNRSTTNLKDAEFQTYLCASLPSIQVGYYFTGGNPVCQQFSRP
jgi:hypothetical protein